MNYAITWFGTASVAFAAIVAVVSYGPNQTISNAQVTN
jgi:hypothetical protein